MLEKFLSIWILLLAIILMFLDVAAVTANASEQNFDAVVQHHHYVGNDESPTRSSFLRSAMAQPAQERSIFESSAPHSMTDTMVAEYNVEPDFSVRNLQENTGTPTPTIATSYNKTVSSYFLWESSMWSQRSLKANVTLDIEAFETTLLEAAENNCDLGITATLFDENAQQIYQQTVGSKYHALEEAGEPFVEGWTGNTTFALYSNSKIFAAVLFMASVVDQGRGYLDEPLYRTFEYLNETDRVGKLTPRMILSHRSSIQAYNRNDPLNDPFYQCMYNATTLLKECVEEFLLNDDALQEEPGTFVRYNNDPFVILADLILRKTGSNDLDQVLKEYLTEPLGMNATTYNCPLVGSTGTKPHVSWGVCSTGMDVPKLIQVLANDGMSSDGWQILTADSVRQILTFQTGIAENADTPLQFDIPLGNCIGRVNEFENALLGYGLGTMITAGVKGILFLHAGTVGGFWLVAPGRYSAYFAWMRKGSFPNVYAWMARVIDRFERASTFLVRNSWEENNWNEITPCIDGMFIESDMIDQYVNRTSSCP